MLEILKHIGRELKTWRSFIFAMWGILSVVYGFMLSHFWWGNHDWDFIKSGVELTSGLFEARYSQHIFNVFLFDGYILPIFSLLFTLLNLILTSVAVTYYFSLQQSKSAKWIIALFLGLNPFTFVLFYYVYLMLPLTFWHLWTLTLLFLVELRFSWKIVFFGGIGYALLLGGYPPVIALCLTLFCAKRIIEGTFFQEKFKESFYKTIVFIGQLGIGAGFFKCIQYWLIKQNILLTGFYNLNVRPIKEMLSLVLHEFFNSLTFGVKDYIFINHIYFLLILILVVGALVCALISCRKNRILVFCWCLGLFISSRILYILSSGTSFAGLRLEYWGMLGISLFGLSVLWHINFVLVKNLRFLWQIVTIIFFVLTVSEIVKSHYFGFEANRYRQTRLIERVMEKDDFSMEKFYMGFAFGNTNFSYKYIPEFSENKCSPELCNQHTFEWETIESIFWENDSNPIIVNKVSAGNQLLLINKRHYSGDDFSDNPTNMKNIRYWLYGEARPYPHKDFLYIDDKYVLMIFDEMDLLKKRELVIQNLDY